MAQIFVSHSSADNELAGKVQHVLAGLGYESVFLDFDPTGGLVPGQAWRDQLFSNLDGCDAVVFITTPASVASQWCHSELALTRWLRKPILALLVDGADPHPLTADLQGLTISAQGIDSERVRAALVALGLDQEARWDPARSPFPGLRAFDESYAAVFFGRDRQIDQLRQLVDPPSRTHEGAIIPVLGPSGSGKSSLVRAGLVPALRVSPDWVVSDPWTPSDVPLAEMSLALAHAAKLHDVDLDADACARLLQSPGGMADYVRELREAGRASADTKVLVIVDQAEELVTITPEAERKVFLEALTTSCTAPSPLRVVMTARTDMWDRVAAETARFAMTVAPTVLHVPPLTRSDLAEVIREPARRSHLTLEDGLLQRLVEDTGSGDALPLLAFTLARMAADARDGRLTTTAYDAIGGVKGAITSRAGEVAHGGRTEAEVAEAILHLVSLSDATPHKRLARAADVPPRHRLILDDLVDARLVVISEVNDQEVYAPAHESLFSAWPPLAALIEKRREDLVLRGRLERRATDWRDAGATTSGLLSGLELDQARSWRERNADLATGDVAAYVDASVTRQRQSRMIRAAVSAVVAALAVTLVVLLLVNARADHRRAEQARIGELAAIAQRELVHDPAAAAAALLRGLALDPDSRDLLALARTLLRSPARDVTRDSADTFFNLAVGGQVGAVSASNNAVVWDTLRETVREAPNAGALAVRPDGRIMVAADGESLKVYDLGGDPADPPAQVSAFSANDDTVPVIEFSPDGALLAESRGSWVTLWDVHDPAAPRQLTTWHANAGQISALAVLDDGRVLASSPRAQLAVWDPLGDGSSTTVLGPSESSVQHLDVDDENRMVLLDAPTGFDSVPLVDLATGATLQSFKALDQDQPPQGVPPVTWTTTMDQSGDLVASFDLAGRGFVFHAADATQVTTLAGGHTSLVAQAGFAADGTLLTAGVDGSLRVWDTRASQEEVGGSMTANLCRVFGGRIDKDSWKVAFENTDVDSPCPARDLPAPSPLDVNGAAEANAVPPVATPRTVVLQETFDSPTTSLDTGEVALGSGTLDRTLRNGRYRMEVKGVGDGYNAWSVAAVAGLGATWSVDVTPGKTQGGCGVTVGDGSTQVTAVVDRAAGTGRLNWFSGGAHLVDFTVPAAQTDDLTLVADGGQLAVLLGGRRVASVRDDTLGTPTSAGLVAVGDSATCDFDDLTVSTSP